MLQSKNLTLPRAFAQPTIESRRKIDQEEQAPKAKSLGILRRFEEMLSHTVQLMINLR